MYKGMHIMHIYFYAQTALKTLSY